MTHKPENFNLLVEPWIPVLRTNGEPDRVGFRTAMTQACQIRLMTAYSGYD